MTRSRPLGITGLIRAFVGKTTFSGNWDEYLDNCFIISYTLAFVCELREQEKYKRIPIILAGNALNYFSNNTKNFHDFDGAMKMLRECYNFDDKKKHILTK